MTTPFVRLGNGQPPRLAELRAFLFKPCKLLNFLVGVLGLEPRTR